MNKAEQQEIHLWTVPIGAVPRAGGGTFPGAPAIPLTLAPAVLTVGPDSLLMARPGHESRDLVVVEPFVNAHKQIRLLARFPENAHPRINGDAAPLWVVLAPGDMFQWAASPIIQVLLFNKPLIGPPPASVIDKPCPVCRVPFTANTTTITCPCGVVLHCETNGEQSLECARMRSECPVCKRAITLTEGYVNPPYDED